MGYGLAPNCNHFTGKTKKMKKSNARKKVRVKQEPHKNKYSQFSNVNFKKQ